MFPTSFINVAFAKVSALYFDKMNKSDEKSYCVGFLNSTNVGEAVCTSLSNNVMDCGSILSKSDQTKKGGGPDASNCIVGDLAEKNVNSINKSILDGYDFEFNSFVSPIKFADALARVRPVIGEALEEVSPQSEKNSKKNEECGAKDSVVVDETAKKIKTKM